MEINLPYKPAAQAISKYETECYEFLEKFINERDENIQSNNFNFIGDFFEIAYPLTTIAYSNGENLTRVLEKAAESVNIVCRACEMGNYDFRDPFTYYIAFWISFFAGDEKNKNILARIESKYYQPGGILIGMLPDILEMMRAFVFNKDKETHFNVLDSFLAMSLKESHRKEEAEIYIPIVEGFRSILKKDQKLWESAEKKRMETWLNEAQKYQSQVYAMFLLDCEWLGLSRLAKEAGLNCSNNNPYVPVDILTIKEVQLGKGLGDKLLKQS